MKNIPACNGMIACVSFIFSTLLISCGASRQATIPITAQTINQAVDSNLWQFTPTQAMPQYGQSRQVNGNYSVMVNGGRLTVYLPYYGQAYGGADVISGRGPLDFSAVDFSIDKKETTPKQWILTVKPVNNPEVQTMNFILYSNGTARLDISMRNRSAISYNGTIEGLKRL